MNCACGSQIMCHPCRVLSNERRCVYCCKRTDSDVLRRVPRPGPYGDRHWIDPNPGGD